eukprot:gene9764-7342_t
MAQAYPAQRRRNQLISAGAAPAYARDPSAAAGRVGVCARQRRRLTDFYAVHNPRKLPSVVDTLLAFKGREERMFDQLTNRYGPEPAPAPAHAPAGWRVAESAEGLLYWVDQHSGRTQWDPPPGGEPIPRRDPPPEVEFGRLDDDGVMMN